ncbi:MAG: Mth938-like domain-containing protein [Gammaproteobacteria bacterium]|nr:Mth938-like domain-containing protein [Gammaproteobacteria bacterium]
MKMALDNAAGANVVTAYEPGQVKVRERIFEASLIIRPGSLHTDWRVTDAASLSSNDLAALLDDPPEVVLLGTGEKQVFPEPAVFALLMDLGVGFEVMDNAAACRTYNILLAEDRRVALALILGRS